MDPAYFPTPDRPLRPGAMAWVGFSATCVASLLTPNLNWRRGLAIPALLYILVSARGCSSGKREEDYMVAVNLVITGLKWIDFVGFRRTEGEIWRVDEGSGNGGKAQIDVRKVREMNLWEKLKWSIGLFSTLRGIGWNWQVKNVPEVPQKTGRYAFVCRQVAGFAYSYLALDFISHALHSRRPISTAAGYFALPLLEQVRLAWLGAFRTGFEMVVGYYLLAAVTVGVGFSKPWNWPPWFGHFARDGYSMRKIWGRCWHQNLRRIFETYTGILCRLLEVKKGSLASWFIKLFGSFFISACIHHAAAMNVPYHPAVRYQLLFFLVQPLAITVEDGIVYLCRRIRMPVLRRCVGYLWVVSFLSYSLRYASAYAFEAGFSNLRHPITNIFSVADWIFGPVDGVVK